MLDPQTMYEKARLDALHSIALLAARLCDGCPELLEQFIALTRAANTPTPTDKGEQWTGN